MGILSRLFKRRDTSTQDTSNEERRLAENKDSPPDNSQGKPVLVMIESNDEPLSDEETLKRILKSEDVRREAYVKGSTIRVRTFGGPLDTEDTWLGGSTADKLKTRTMKTMAMVITHAPEYDAMKAKTYDVKDSISGVTYRVIICPE